jgi:predicted acylesterase/phospholipase RssA
MRLAGIHCDVISGSRCGAVILGAVLVGAILPVAAAVLTTTERTALAHEKFLENRRASITNRVNPYLGPGVAQVVEELPRPW